ncbi:MAG: histidine kinase [Ruminococcus sp.]|nr:histidine kinase [Candidatus Apopatosoma intestinale]
MKKILSGISGKTARIAEKFFFAFAGLVWAVILIFTIFPIVENTEHHFINGLIYLITMLLDLFLFVSCTVSPGRNQQPKNKIKILAWLGYFSTASSALICLWNGAPSYLTAQKILSVSCHFFIAGFTYCLWLYVDELLPRDKWSAAVGKFVLVGCVIFGLTSLANLFVPILFSSGDGGPIRFSEKLDIYNYFEYIWQAVFVTEVLRRKCSGTVKLFLFSVNLFPAMVTVGEAILKKTGELIALPSLLYLASVLSLYIIFFNVYAAREYEILAKEKELADSKVGLMMAEINPHFVYNTLGSIASLCRTDPDGAEDLICKFSDYLRNHNKNVMGNPMIPFSEEIKILESYLMIEKVRFPDITIVYRLEATHFMIPCMSVQPLAENAIRHGICRRRGSKGTLTVSSCEEEKAFIVRIEDDGVGFDPAQTDDQQHIGVSNVATRLSLLCGGTLSVQSVPGKGTVSTITIPKEEQI